MSRVNRSVAYEEERQRSSSTSSFTGLQYQAELNHQDRQLHGRSANSRSASSKSLNPLDERSEKGEQYNNKRPKPNLDHLGKENIKRPNNQHRKPQQFFEQEMELKRLRRAKQELQVQHKEQLTAKEEQLMGLYHLKEENRQNLEQLAKLRHLTSQFEIQLRRLAKDKENCQQNLKDAMRQITVLKDKQPAVRLQEQYELICAENRQKIHALEGQLRSTTQSLEEAGRDNQLLRSQLSEKQFQPSQQQRLNEYVAKVSQAQNRANQLQIRYFRMQKENDENKQAKSEVEFELRELRQSLQSQKQLFQEEEDRLLGRVKQLQSERRRSEIEKANQLHEKDVLHGKLRKQKESEIDRLKLQIDKLTFELQESSKELKLHQIERESDVKAYKLSLESLELEYRKAASELEQNSQNSSRELDVLRNQLSQIRRECADHVQVIALLQKKLELSSKQNKDKLEELRSHYEKLIEERTHQLNSARLDNEQRQESMIRYGREMESIKHEFKSILQERDAVLRQLEGELEEKDSRIQSLENFMETKQTEFERQFDQLQATVQGSQAKMSSSYRSELQHRDQLIAAGKKTLQESQNQLTSLRLNLETALNSNSELKEELGQITRLFTQTKVDMSSLRQSFQDENNNKQFQLSKLFETNQHLQQENKKIGILTLTLKEKSQQLEEDCQRLSKTVEQEQQRVRDLSVELAAFRTSNERLREEITQLTQQRQTDQLEFNIQRQFVADEVAKNTTTKLESSYNSQLQLLRSELTMLRSHQSSLSEDLNKKQKYICMLESQNRKGEASLATYIRTVNEQKQQAEGRDSELQQRRKQLCLKEEQLSLLRNKLQEIECRLETRELQISTDRQLLSSLRHENVVLKQVEESLRQTQQSKFNCQQEKKQLQQVVEQKNTELIQLSERCRQLDQAIRQLNEQHSLVNIKLNEREGLLIESKKTIDGRNGQLDGLRRQLEQAIREKRHFEQRVHQIEASNSKQHEQSSKATAELQHLRKNLESMVNEYESLRQAHESSSNRLLAMKSERDSRTVELEQARMRIRILESENRSIHGIMTDELDKRKRIIEGLVRQKNSAIGEMERSKISRQ